MNHNVVTAKLQHVVDMKDKLRIEDRREMYNFWGMTPEQGLGFSFLSSKLAWTAFYNNRPCAMFGVTPDTQKKDTGTPWLLATDEFSKITKGFLRDTEYYMGQCFNVYPMLENVVDPTNIKAIRWIKFSGLMLSELVHINGHPAITFKGNKTQWLSDYLH
jgi:hypothetical protein